MKKIGIGATANIYLDGNHAVKVYQSASLNEVQNEFKNQFIAVKLGISVPEVHEVKTMLNGKTALVMDYIAGVTLINEHTKPDEIEPAIKSLVKIQRNIHQLKTNELPCLQARLIKKIDKTAVKEETKNALKNMLVQQSNVEKGICHMDFHPLNVLIVDDKTFVIDWVDAASGNPLIDICRTYLLLDSVSADLSGLYLQQFEEKDRILAWLPVIACVRLSEKLTDEEEKKLYKILADFENLL